MAAASDPGTRDCWKWSAYNEVTAQGPSSGCSDDIIQARLEEGQNLTPTLVAKIETKDNKLHTIIKEAAKHSTNSFI
eukprot:756996-Pelagomonas_calceolata.AAC.1